MTARIFSKRHWQEAQARRACRHRAAQRSAAIEAASQARRPTLDEILNPTFNPWGGAA